jgi:PAS domain S-box-containing protein
LATSIDTMRHGATSPIGERTAEILHSVADGVTVQDRSGRLVYANEPAVRMIGFESSDELLAATPDEILARFELFDEHGHRLDPELLPGRRALNGEEPEPLTVRFRALASGEEQWAVVRAAPLRDADGEIAYAVNTFHEITDRVLAEADVRASEAMYREIAEAMPTIAWTTDAAGLLRHANRRWQEYAGEAPATGRGLPDEPLVHDDDRVSFASRWQAALASGLPMEATCRLRAADGSYRWHVIRAVPIRSEGGEVSGWIGTSTDIDEAVRAQRSLRDAEGRLSALFASVLAGIAQIDLDGRFLFVNDRYVEITGRSASELYRLRLQDIAHPDDLAQRMELLRGLIDDGRPFVIEKRYVRPDGATVWVRDSVSGVRDEAGSITSLVVISNDISEERRIAEEARLARGEAQAAESALSLSEGRFRSLATATSDVIWTASVDGSMRGRQPAWEAFTGQNEAAYQGRGWLDAVHPEDRAAREQLVEETRETPEYFETSYRLRRHDGVYRRVLVRGVPIQDADGGVREYVGSVTDVEDERRAIERLEILARASKALDASLDPAETVAAAVRTVVPELADWSVVDLIDPDGSVRRAAVVTADPDKQELAEQLFAHPMQLGGETAGAIAVREERAVLVEGLTPSALRRRSQGPRHAALLQALGAHSIIAAPLRARERVLGAMFFVASREDRRFDQADVELAGELAARAGLAIANAQLHSDTQRALAAAEIATQRTEQLRSIGSALADARSQTEAAEIAVRKARAATGAAGGHLAVARGDVLITAASEGLPGKLIDASRQIPLASDHPLARIAVAGEPRWIHSITHWSDEQPPPIAAARLIGKGAAAVLPLYHESEIVGLFSLTWAEPRDFDDTERTFLLALAGQTAQALVRVGLLEAREILFADLESQRARLETVLAQMPSGVLIADREGRLVMANGRAGEIWRGEIPTGRAVDAYRELVGLDANGRRLKGGDWPLVRALRGGEIVVGAELEILRLDGTRGWIVTDAAPVRDGSGNVVAAVAVFSDITERRQATANNAFLAEASAVLASSLDYEETIARVAQLAVPRIADWCVVHLVGDDQAVHQVALAHSDPRKVALARRLQLDHPPDPNAERGAQAVIRSGRADLMTEVPPDLIEGLARNDRERRLLARFQIRSYLSVPLVWEGRTLGAMTFIGAESGRRFTEVDLGFAQDVADRAAAAIQRARLFRDADRFRQILDTIADVTLAIDPVSLRVTYANQGAIDQLGYTRDELLALQATDVADDLDESAFRALIEPLITRTREARTVTQAYRASDGRVIPVEILLQYVETPGDAGRIVTVARDITDRVDAQSRLQRLARSEHARAAELNAVLQALGDGVVVCNADGRVTLANPAAERIFPGIAAAGYADIVAQLEEPDGASPELGARGGPVELRIRGPEERWIELSTWPVESRRDPTGATETIVMLRDVTTARQRQVVRDTFVGVLSHELRTPVTTIFAGAKLLARDASTMDPDVRQSVFEDIHAEAERLHRLVEDVVALTRFGEEEVEIGQEPVLLQRIMPNVVRSEEVRWPGVSFRLRMPPGLPTVTADPTYVEQVVRNLLSNAAKYGGSEPVHLEADSDDEEVRIRILDDGPGFDAQEAPRLFELFYRSPTTAGRAAGAGIGLYVCARLIQAMGGRIWARPRPEGGSEFGFALRIMNED